MNKLSDALPWVAFWIAIGAIGVALNVYQGDEPPPIVLNCPDGYAPKYYRTGGASETQMRRWGQITEGKPDSWYAECVKAE